MNDIILKALISIPVSRRIKMHTKFDLGKNIPETIVVTNAKVHDKNKLHELMSEENCIYIYDKAYVDYEQSDYYTKTNIFFIILILIPNVICVWLC